MKRTLQEVGNLLSCFKKSGNLPCLEWVTLKARPEQKQDKSIFVRMKLGMVINGGEEEERSITKEES